MHYKQKPFDLSTGLPLLQWLQLTDPEDKLIMVLNKLVSVTFNMPMKVSTISSTSATFKTKELQLFPEPKVGSTSDSHSICAWQLLLYTATIF
jgi:hypothetical protein